MKKREKIKRKSRNTAPGFRRFFHKKASRKTRITLAKSQDLVTLSKTDTNIFGNLLKVLTRFGSVRFETFKELGRFDSVRFGNISVRFGSV
jgi:hypothetical protein